MIRESERPFTRSTLNEAGPKTLARVRNVGRVIERRWADLVSLVEQAIEETEEQAAEAGVDVAFMWTVPGVVKAEPASFVGALRSLIAVSVDATERDGRVGVHLYGLERMVLEVRYGRRKRISKMRSPQWLEAIERCRHTVEPMGGTVVVHEDGGSPVAVQLHLPFE